jgi:BlaI family penicillinase repressor
MNQRKEDVTEAELALLQSLWDDGPATIRQLVDRVYRQSGTSIYATVQKLLDRLESKGSLSPLLTHLVEGQGLSESERRELRTLIEKLDRRR